MLCLDNPTRVVVRMQLLEGCGKTSVAFDYCLLLCVRMIALTYDFLESLD